MLTLGSPKTDARYTAVVRDRMRCQFWLSESLPRYEQDIRRRLLRLIRRTMAGSDLYDREALRQVGLSTDPLEGFRTLPLLGKPELRAMVDHVSHCSPDPAPFTAETSGSTGIPLRMLFGVEHFVSYFARFLSLLRRHGIHPAPLSTSMMTVSVFPHCQDYCHFQPVANNSFYHRININERYWESPAAAVECISRESPAILRGMPSSLEHLSDILEHHPPTAAIRPALIVTSAETLLPAVRQRLQQVFGAPVVDEYGLTEVGGMVAQECALQRGFHLLPMDFFVEVVDDSGLPVGDGGEGEIVITNLYNRIVPLLRYRTNDYGVLTHDPCPCGSALPRIARLTGRALTRFSKPDGTTYNPFDAVGRFLLRLPVAQFQLVQQGQERIVLRYSGDRDISALADTRSVAEVIGRIHGDRSEFSLERVDGFPSDGKFQAFLREGLPAGGGAAAGRSRSEGQQP